MNAILLYRLHDCTADTEASIVLLFALLIAGGAPGLAMPNK